MKKKLSSILLVDDDKDCNFFHERLLRKIECVEKVYTAIDGKEAIEFLRSAPDGRPPSPAIIFLDINMPRVNGWEFLEEYKKLSEAQKAKIVLIILTTSLNSEDMERGLSNPDVRGFYNKYLSKDTLHKILIENFSDHF